MSKNHLVLGNQEQLGEETDKLERGAANSDHSQDGWERFDIVVKHMISAFFGEQVMVVPYCCPKWIQNASNRPKPDRKLEHQKEWCDPNILLVLGISTTWSNDAISAMPLTVFSAQSFLLGQGEDKIPSEIMMSKELFGMLYEMF